MDEDSEVGYMYPTSNMDLVNLEIKLLTKKYVYLRYLFLENVLDSISKHLPNRPKMNDRIFVEVMSSNLLDSITYQVVSHAKIIYSESLTVPHRGYHVFSFLATFDLMPRADLIVYYFKDDDIISAKLSIDMRGDLSNFVKLKLSDTQVKPGDSVKIDILSNEGSYVGLLAIDQSVLLLKRNADLTIDDAWNERELFQHHYHDKIPKQKSSTTYFHQSYWSDFQV